MIWHQPTNSRGNYNYNSFFYTDCEWRHHFHKNFELIYVFSGNLQLKVDSISETISAGDFALIHPNQVHSFNSIEENYIWIAVFSEDFVKEFARITKGKYGLSLAFKCSDAEQEYLKSVLLTNEKQDILSLKACLYTVCNRYLKEIKTSEKPNINTDLAHVIIDFTEKNFRENITLADIAKETGYEYHYFSRCFKRIFNINFKTFLNQYRFNYAENLILQGEKSLAEIAMESGFGSVRNFNRIYRRFANKTPTAIKDLK